MAVPYQQESINEIYNLLFCDQLELYKNHTSSPEDPWMLVLSDAINPEKLIQLSQDPDVPSRLRLLAYRRLHTMNQPINTNELLGVIVEIRFANGLDTLAVYKDGSARYINQAGKLIVWDHRTEISDKAIGNIFRASQVITDQILPCYDKRTPHPAEGRCKVTFLVSDQLHSTEGPFNEYSAHPVISPVISAAFGLLQYLMATASMSTV